MGDEKNATKPRVEQQLAAAWQRFIQRTYDLQSEYQRHASELADNYSAACRAALGQTDPARRAQDAYASYVKDWFELNSPAAGRRWEHRYQQAWEIYVKELQAVCARLSTDALDAREIALIGQYLSASACYASNLGSPPGANAPNAEAPR